MSAEVRQKMKELLSKYSHGLWAHALPKLFISTFKMPFPEDVLENLSPLMDICSVEYPMPNDKKKVSELDYTLNRSEHNVKVKEVLNNTVTSPWRIIFLILTVNTHSHGHPDYLFVLEYLYLLIRFCHLCISLWSGHPV